MLFGLVSAGFVRSKSSYNVGKDQKAEKELMHFSSLTRRVAVIYLIIIQLSSIRLHLFLEIFKK